MRHHSLHSSPMCLTSLDEDCFKTVCHHLKGELFALKSTSKALRDLMAQERTITMLGDPSDEWIRWAHRNGCRVEALTNSVAYHGNLLALNLVRTLDPCFGKSKLFKDSVMEHGCRGGHVACLEYGATLGGDPDEELSLYAAKSGTVDCLKYIYEKGWPIAHGSLSIAVEEGNLDCVQFLARFDCQFPVLHHSLVESAAAYGRYDCLRFLLERSNGPYNGEIAATYAAEEGNLDCLRLLHEKGCPCNTQAILFAVEEGNLDCVKYLHEQGCPWSEELLLIYASRSCNPDCQMYANHMIAERRMTGTPTGA
jgi:hypothetical protein